MIVRRIKENENAGLAKVECMGFLYSANLREAAEGTVDSEAYGAFTDDEKTMMAAIYTPEYHSWCGDETLASVGIGGVASIPEFRRHGCVRAIFQKIFSLAPERGWVTSTLYPFSFDYYRQFGYERVFKKYTVTCPAHVLDCCPRNCDVKLYDYEHPEVLDDVLLVYNTYAKKHGLMYRRDEKCRAYSKDPYKSMKMTYVHYTNGAPDATATVHRDHEAMEVSQLAWLNPTGLRGILGFIRAFDGQVNEYRFDDLPSPDCLEHVLHNYIDIGYEADSCGMGRVLLLGTLLEKWVYPKAAGHFRLRCEDDLEWNRAVWDVTYADGKATVVKLPYEEAYDISAAVAPMSRIIMEGGFTAELAAYLDGVEIVNEDGTEAFCRAFPKCDFYLHDRF